MGIQEHALLDTGRKGAPLSVTIYGGTELRKALKEAAGDTDDLKRLNVEIAEMVADEARRNVPIRTGTLKGSIKAFGAASKARVTAGSKRVPYAMVIHWGWPQRNLEGSFFITNAMEKKQEEILDYYEIELEQILHENGLK
jgi:hypothetical protein|tara:strand:+ start:1073 stop:1495 length:423 start_codon:yes stop_codon:yes gene_type:complete